MRAVQGVRVSSTVTKRNPRPRKYASASERQAAYRARAPEVCFRAEPQTADKLDQIAADLDVSRADLLLSMTKFALTNHDWARFGLTHRPLPFEYGIETRKANPMKKPTPAQLAARARFAEMARSGAFKRKAKAKRNPAKKTVSQKISQLVHEGYPQKQAVAVALSEQRKGKVKRNLITETLIYGLPAGETRDYMEELLYGGGLKLTEAQIQQVLKAASDAGFHSFRVTGFDPTKRPDFAKAVATRSRKRNPATGRKGSQTKLNPMASPVKVYGASNYPYSVEAKRVIPGGSVFEALAGFPNKKQAMDYAQAIQASHPSVTLRIKHYTTRK